MGTSFYPMKLSYIMFDPVRIGRAIASLTQGEFQIEKFPVAKYIFQNI